jgi:hypothetical protein
LSVESFVQVPTDSTGKKLRAINRTTATGSVFAEVVEITDTGSGTTMTPAKTEQFPTTLTSAGNLKVALFEGALNSGSIGITGSSVAFNVTGSIGVSGSVTLTTTGSIALAPNNAGVLLFASGSGLKVKVYSAGYSSPLNVKHCFYFGNTTTLTANAFLVTSGSGTYRQTYVQPVVSAASQGLYIWSSGSESNMDVDVEYVLE